MAATRDLFQQYAASLNIDLCFQGFPAELKDLPGMYAPPQGRLLLAVNNYEAVGCVAMRPLESGVCEMKRLFVQPTFRGHGIGRALAEQVISEARAIGHTAMRLDTLPHMASALELYRALGFQPCPAYYRTPLKETVFMELGL